MRVLENFFLSFRSSIEVVLITALLAAVAYRDGKFGENVNILSRKLDKTYEITHSY